MLKDEDRIITNLYNDMGPDILYAKKIKKNLKDNEERLIENQSE